MKKYHRDLIKTLNKRDWKLLGGFFNRWKVKDYLSYVLSPNEVKMLTYCKIVENIKSNLIEPATYEYANELRRKVKNGVI